MSESNQSNDDWGDFLLTFIHFGFFLCTYITRVVNYVRYPHSPANAIPPLPLIFRILAGKKEKEKKKVLCHFYYHRFPNFKTKP